MLARLPFRIRITIHLSLIILAGVAAMYFWMYTPFTLMTFWMGAFMIVGTVSLIRFLERNYRELNNYLLAIKQHDFTNYYANHKSSNTLHQAFNVITDEFVKLRRDKESSYHFFKTIVEHSRVPLLAYNLETEQVVLINEAAKELLRVPYLSKISSLSRIDAGLTDTIKSIESDQKVLLKTKWGNEHLQLSILAKNIILKEVSFKVVILHNINSELDQQEIESWQKLIKVLTHEIKNSVIPISTLAEVINHMLWTPEGDPLQLEKLEKEDEEDLRQSLKTIEKRSKGLVNFVNAYGDLAKLPRPKKEKVDFIELLHSTLKLYQEEFEKRNITVNQRVRSKSIELHLDADMIEQVLINVIKNAVEALDQRNHPTIDFTLINSGEDVILSIRDNGLGIDAETMSNIFVPFYTTKKEGSGIGLPFSKQIMRAHGGDLRIHSTPERGTTCEIQFRKRSTGEQ